MKVYMAYLILDKNELYSMDPNVVGKKDRFVQLEDGRHIGLYAFTHDKTTFKAFSNDRGLGKNKYLVKRVVKMDDDYYEEFRSLHSDFELSMYKLQCGDKMYTWIPMTSDEYYNIHYSSEEVAYELLMSAVSINYSIFNDDVIDALETIFYCHYWDIMYGDESDVDARSWNASYLGSPDELWKNQLGFFTLLYRDLISIEDLMVDAMGQMEEGEDNDE